ncbi:hypothetical protein Ancab_032511 [Ancistrocladus abbreviatus]
MKGVFTAPGDYVYFKSQVPLHKIPVRFPFLLICPSVSFPSSCLPTSICTLFSIPNLVFDLFPGYFFDVSIEKLVISTEFVIGTKQWRYYDFGPKLVPPLICIPGTAGTADVYYKQIMALSMKGYRVISIDIPRVWNHHEWIQAFEKFLDAVDVHHIHIYGTSLGGFLAQVFAQHRPRRVRSLILSNTYLETRTFSSAMPWAPIVSWTPAFLLKRYVLTGIKDGPHEPFIADSVDFVVSQVEMLSREDLASRMTLTVDSASVGPLLLSDAFITIMDTNDYCAIPQQLKDEVGERYPGARRAYLKSGGDFPFLSRPDEVNLHLQLHLRRVGVEARPDLVPGAPKNRVCENPSTHNEREEDHFSPRDEKESSGGPSKIGVRDDVDDLSKDEDDEESPDGPLQSNEREDSDHPPKDDDDDDNEASPNSPSNSDERGDTSDSPNDGGGSYEGPSKNEHSENPENPTKDGSGGSSGHSEDDLREDVGSSAKYNEQSSERHPESTDSQDLDKQLMHHVETYYLIPLENGTLLLLEQQGRVVNRTSCDLRWVFLLACFYFLPIHLEALYITNWINCCMVQSV